MVLLFILWGAFGGAATIETLHYQDCAKAGFPAPICNREKTLSGLKTKN